MWHTSSGESKSCPSGETAGCVQHGLKYSRIFRHDYQVIRIDKHVCGAAVKAVATSQLNDGLDHGFHS